MAALMPPAAAPEWERTGWTLLMIATVAPASAAARAARWPARPAPMIRTSCAGMALPRRSWGERTVVRAGPRPGCDPGGPTAPGRRLRALPGALQGPSWRRGGERALDLLDRDDPAQAPVGVED